MGPSYRVYQGSTPSGLQRFVADLTVRVAAVQMGASEGFVSAFGIPPH